MLGIASVAVALAAADTYVVVLALTDMMSGVGVGIQDLNRATPIISGFLLGYIAVLPLIGRLSDLISRRQVLLACLGIFIVGSVITAVAVELPVLVGGRVIQGVGGGGLVPATLALVADLWPVQRRGLPLGVVGAVQEAGSVLGPVFGAAILSVGGWRLIFWVNAVAGLALALGLRLTMRGEVVGRTAGGPPTGVKAPAVAVVTGALGLGVLVLALVAPRALVTHLTWGIPFVPFTGTARLATPVGLVAFALLLAWVALSWRGWRPTLRRVDLVGAGCLAIALGCLVLTFATASPDREVVGPSGFALIPLGFVAAAGWGWRQRTAADPLIPPRALSARGVGVALGVSLLTGAALVAVVVDVPVLARLTYTDDQIQAAFVLVRFLVALPVGALLGGWCLRRWPASVPASAGLALAATGLWTMHSWQPGALDGAAGVGATLTLAAVGLGLGAAIAPVNAAALATAQRTDHGVVSGLVVVARMVGMVLGLALLTAVGLRRYYLTVQDVPPPVAPSVLLDAALVQVQTVFLGGAIAAGLGALLALRLARSPSDVRHPRTSTRTESP